MTQAEVTEALKHANSGIGGSVVETAKAEYIARATGYLSSLDDFLSVPIRTASGGVQVVLCDVATVQVGSTCAAAWPI